MIQVLHLTGADISVFREITSLQAAPAALPIVTAHVLSPFATRTPPAPHGCPLGPLWLVNTTATGGCDRIAPAVYEGASIR